MKTDVQLIRLESGSYMVLHEVLFTSATGGKLRFGANPVSLRREEIFNIDGNQVVTESYFFPIQYLFQWLIANGAINDETKAVSNIGFEDILKPIENLTK